MKPMQQISEEILEATLSVLEDFASELKTNYLPPGIPYEKEALTRGWSVRLDSVEQKIQGLPRAERLLVCSRLAGILSVFDSYIVQWEKRLQEVDPLLVSYKFMPGDFNAMDT